MKDLKYFELSEFDSPDVPGSGEEMHRSTLEMLDKARAIAGIPFSVTSGYRSEAWNEKTGGVDSSAHTRGYAVDLRCSNGRDRYKILTAALQVGFNRIGVAQNFIHLDNDPKKPGYVIWTY